MISLVSFALCLAAFSALSLAMERHHVQVFGTNVAKRQLTWRSLGWTLMLAAAIYSIHSLGIGIGLVLWCGVLTIAGVLVAWLLPYRPRRLLPTTSAVSVGAFLAWALETAA